MFGIELISVVGFASLHFQDVTNPIPEISFSHNYVITSRPIYFVFT